MQRVSSVLSIDSNVTKIIVTGRDNQIMQPKNVRKSFKERKIVIFFFPGLGGHIVLSTLSFKIF